LGEKPKADDGKQQQNDDRCRVMPTSKTAGVLKEVRPGAVPLSG
jgi:hypothetical protein